MRRRKFISLLGGAIAWPIVARAQQGERRIGMLVNGSEADAEVAARVATFRKALQDFGWVPGTNLRVDARFGGNDDDLHRKARELVELAPDVILASSSVAVAALQRASRSVPIVFVAVVDPVGSGFVANLARPGGNATGFTNFEYGLSGKWLELLKEISPAVRRAAVLRDAASPGEIGMLAALQSAAPSFGMELSTIGMRDAGEIEHETIAFARAPNGGLIVLGSALANTHRDLIILLTDQHRLPAVYPDRIFVANGGLISYGPDRTDQFRRAASYVDRILKGERPADLPVQAPTKYELVVNIKTAKAQSLAIPLAVLARADDVIE
jgi:putative tryptophan/tyrosine transport system substrate-binding protein